MLLHVCNLCVWACGRACEFASVCVCVFESVCVGGGGVRGCVTVLLCVPRVTKHLKFRKLPKN